MLVLIFSGEQMLLSFFAENDFSIYSNFFSLKSCILGFRKKQRPKRALGTGKENAMTKHTCRDPCVPKKSVIQNQQKGEHHEKD